MFKRFSRPLLFVCLSFLLLTAESRGGNWVRLPNRSELYVEYAPAAQGRPTLVVLNGLTYETTYWRRMLSNLSGQGYGLLLYDMRGQGRTLQNRGPATYVIPFQDQVEDLRLLLNELRIPAPISLMGLSYGGGIAQAFAARFPNGVRHLVLMAPYTIPIPSQDSWIKDQIRTTRILFPNNPASDDELYDFFLHQLVISTYPAAEPDILDGPYKLEGCFRLVQGIRKLNVFNLMQYFPRRSVHLMIAEKDQYLDRGVLDRFWDSLAPEQRASRIIIRGSEHKIDRAVPRFSAGWLHEILEGRRELFNGQTFDGNPRAGEARDMNVVIRLPQE